MKKTKKATDMWRVLLVGRKIWNVADRIGVDPDSVLAVLVAAHNGGVLDKIKEDPGVFDRLRTETPESIIKGLQSAA